MAHAMTYLLLWTLLFCKWGKASSPSSSSSVPILLYFALPPRKGSFGTSPFSFPPSSWRSANPISLCLSVCNKSQLFWIFSRAKAKRSIEFWRRERQIPRWRGKEKERRPFLSHHPIGGSKMNVGSFYEVVPMVWPTEELTRRLFFIFNLLVIYLQGLGVSSSASNFRRKGNASVLYHLSVFFFFSFFRPFL